MADSDQKQIKILRRAFKEQRLTLFLGAGVSVANGLPNWEKLVLSLYFATIGEQNLQGWRPFSNYLYAISEWYLAHTKESLEITARKVRSFYENSVEGEAAFLEAIRDAIYGVESYMEPEPLLHANRTLKAVVELCSAQKKGRHGVRSVITYNYDSLVEMTLGGRRPLVPIYAKDGEAGDALPIYHVHGYVPFDPAELEETGAIIFTEDQYNIVASDPYSWSNMVQLSEMSGNVGLMVGLSLADRNIRRLLDALSQSPVKPNIVALLQKQEKMVIDHKVADSIHDRAIEIFQNFQRSGIKSEGGYEETAGRDFGRRQGMQRAGVKAAAPVRRAGRKGEKRYQYQIRGIFECVESLEQEQQENVLGQLGITPIWYDKHDEIPAILAKIA